MLTYKMKEEVEKMDETNRELDALLNYLINHNAEHAGEINELAERVHATEKQDVYEHLLRGVEYLNLSNESLKKALNLLRKKV